MRIAFLADYFLPHAGGSRVYYHALYSRLGNDLGEQVFVLTKKVPGWREFDRLHSSDRVRIIRRWRPLPNWKYQHLPRMVAPLLDAAGLLAAWQPEMIHCGDLYPQGVISLCLKRFTGTPYLAYCHGEEITQTDCRRHQPRIRNAIFRNAEAVVAASEFAHQALLGIGIPETRVHKIVPGVDCERFRPRPKPPRLVRSLCLEGKRVLLTVGRLVPRKGHRTVLEALAQLAPEMPDLAYVIAGTGPSEQDLRALAGRLGVESAVRFAGYVREEDLAGFYNLCDLFVMPNHEEVRTGDIEGFGMVFLEAGASGKTVIAGRSGGTAEAVVEGRTGCFVEPESPDQLAIALRTLLENPEIPERLGAAGRQRACSEFSWDSRALALREVSAEILRRGREGALA